MLAVMRSQRLPVGCRAWDLKKYGPEQINHLKQTLELTCDRQIAVEPMVDPRVEALGEALDASIGSFKQMCAASALTVGRCSHSAAVPTASLSSTMRVCQPSPGGIALDGRPP